MPWNGTAPAQTRSTEEACSLEFARLNFQPVYVQGHVRQVLSHYLMTEDGFAFAVLGFTGVEAARFKEAYIAEFNHMADELARRNLPVAPADPLSFLEDPDILRSLLGRYAEEAAVERQGRLLAEAAVEAARPAVDFAEALADSVGTWGLRTAGKALHQPPNKFVAWLRERGDLYDLNGGPVAKEALVKRGLFTVAWEMHGGKPRPTTKVTGKGVVHYARAIGVRPPGAPAQGLLPGIEPEDT